MSEYQKETMAEALTADAKAIEIHATRSIVMWIVVVLCALSFMAGVGVNKSWGSEGHHADMGIVDIVSKGEGCPIKQMYADRDLHAYIIYYQKGDFTFDNVDEVFDKINVVRQHFIDKAIPKGRLVIGVSSSPEWHDGIEFKKGDGVYIILKH